MGCPYPLAERIRSGKGAAKDQITKEEKRVGRAASVPGGHDKLGHVAIFGKTSFGKIFLCMSEKRCIFAFGKVTEDRKSVVEGQSV